MDGQDIADLGGPEPVASVTFDEAGLNVDLGDSELIVNYSDSVIGVFGRPEPTEEPGRSSLGRACDGAPLSLGEPRSHPASHRSWTSTSCRIKGCSDSPLSKAPPK